MRIFFFLVTCLISIASYSQSFLPQNSGVSTQLNAISFSTPNSGIVVGNSGVIRRTTNSGLNWSGSSSGTTGDLLDIASIGPTSYIAVGVAGTMIKTTNSGSSWSVVNSGTSNDLTSIFVNGQYVYITGSNGTILKSSNSGSAWSTLNTGISLKLNEAYFVSDVVGYVVGDAGTILKTTNGGGAWSFLNSGATGYSLKSVCFPDGMHGAIIGVDNGNNQSVILHSIDAGNNWSPENYPNILLSKLSFVDYMQGYAVGGNISGNSSNIYHTTTYGVSWTSETSSSSRQLGVSTPSADVIYTCGLNGTILRYATNTSGINEVEELLGIEISPNPSKEIFSITSEANTNELFSLEVFSLDGTFLLKLDNTNEINLTNFPSGIYFAVIKSDSKVAIRKLVKE